jgi:hypothetical protein
MSASPNPNPVDACSALSQTPADITTSAKVIHDTTLLDDISPPFVGGLEWRTHGSPASPYRRIQIPCEGRGSGLAAAGHWSVARRGIRHIG